MNYERVIPRDFFNEAKLLKCMGQLSLAILDCSLPEGVSIEISESGEPFDIRLTDDGMLMVVNYPVLVNGRQVEMGTVYNSKEAFPLDCVIDYENIRVFNDSGKFYPEFIERFTLTEKL